MRSISTSAVYENKGRVSKTSFVKIKFNLVG